LWDTAGQEDYDRLRPLAYPQSDVFAVLFSCSSRTSFENVKKKWWPEVSFHCPGVPIVLCMTKTDLLEDKAFQKSLEEKGQTMVTHAEGMAVAKEIGAVAFCPFSALTQDGIKVAFETCIRASLVKRVTKKKRKVCSVS